ncbi:hypothetical protein PHET_07183 [Paragonimus heterotremus]|uniref:Uncharacterized protein n=1 Tax=Paragonimus heterotremus TaxID=100268 RepID=A0A8J4SFP3_9TREM|nr:hypothetical protein PHET_07183 [Paragonimus heterotremus]
MNFSMMVSISPAKDRNFWPFSCRIGRL